MYTAFDLKINIEDFVFQNNYEIEEYYKLGSGRKNEVQSLTKTTLKEYVKNGIIDGSSLSDTWFKTIESDVFISYSHNDGRLAMILAGFMEKHFNLKIFVDSLFWGSADKYCCRCLI